MPKKQVEVTQIIEVEIDSDVYTKEDLESFRKDFYNFLDYDDHIEHLAQLKARGIISWHDCFVEGYGRLDEVGISVSEIGYVKTQIL